MVLAQYQADTEDESEILVNFLASLDLKDFSRVLLKAGMTLEALQACQNADLQVKGSRRPPGPAAAAHPPCPQRLGLPTTARRRILAKLNPT